MTRITQQLLVLEDDILMAELLKSHLKESFVVHTAITLDEAVEKARAQKPVAALCDVSLGGINVDKKPNYDGLEAAARIKAENVSPATLCMVFTSAPPVRLQRMVLDAFQRGFDGFLLRSAQLAKVSDALATLIETGNYVDGGVTAYLRPDARRPSLSPIQEKIVRGLIDGHKQTELVSLLNLPSIDSLRSHLRKAMTALDVTTPEQLVAKFQRLEDAGVV